MKIILSMEEIMFEFTFGLIWTAFTAFAMWAFTSPGGTAGQSGTGVAWVILILFLVIGIFLMIKGLKRIVTDAMTGVKGVPINGVVVDVLETGAYSNGRPQLKARIMAIMPDRTVREFYEVIGFNYNKYKLGECVNLKYYKNDVNIVGLKADNQLTYDELETVERIRNENGCTGEYVQRGGTVRTYHNTVAKSGYRGGNGYDNNDYGYSNNGYAGDGYDNGGYNDGYTTHNVQNVGVHKVDEETVIIDGVEYKKNGF